jgi:hypothetical protein
MPAGNYTYDPTKITDGGVDQMRFELGDTVVDMGGVSSPLCDEEYAAILAKYPKWKIAKLKCLEAIVFKLSYEVNTSVGGLSYSLDQRYERWKKLLEEDKKIVAGIAGVPTAGDPNSLIPNGLTPTPYYYNDMQANLRKF